MALVAPELRAPLRKVPPLPLGSGWGRRLMRALGRLMPAATLAGITLELRNDITPGLRIYRPDTRRSAAALLWIHGGGMLIGQPSQDDHLCAATARTLGIVVVSVEYRLAPEHPFPLPLDDCYAGWQWLQRAAETLAIDPARVAVGGESAGAGLAASLAQRVHDAGGRKPAAQWLFCPMLDDRTAARRELDALGHYVWDNRLNRIGWRAFLATEPGAAELPPYAVAARRADLRGLPPAWVGVGEIDLFYAEDRAYTERLGAAGVEATFDVVPGAPHGFTSWGADAPLARDLVARAQAWLQQALASNPSAS